MKIAVIQSDNLPYDKAKLSFFMHNAKREGARLVVLPEYVLNRFFKEIEKTPLSFIKNQTNHQIKHLKHLANIYDLKVIAPIVKIINNKKYKAIVKIDKNIKYYYQQALMPYSHWNEDKFFDKKEMSPMVFKTDGFKFGVMFGFEAHIHKFWEYFKEKKVEVVLIPSIGTFNSHQRWLELCKTKAFLNHLYVIRANRIGYYNNWKFYGKSFVLSPEGEIINILGNKEEIAVVELNKDKIKEAKKEWKFLDIEKSIKHF